MRIHSWLLYVLPMALSSTAGNHCIYSSEVIRFNSNGVFLEGQLDLPNSEGRVPMAVFVHGSGMRTRADYADFIAPFLQNNIAVFRFDKRGVGNSGGSYSDVDVSTENSPVTIHTLAMDVAAAIKYLKGNTRIDSSRCVLVGASQAGWIIPVAAELEDIYATAIFSGPTVSVGEEIYYSSLAESKNYSVADANKMVLSSNHSAGFDPIPYLRKLDRPSLWIFGDQDESIPIDHSLQILKQVRDEFHQPIYIEIVSGANHGMRFRDGTRSDYVSDILRWINNNNNNGRPPDK
ncbi:MAG TPA: alpha/beta fold hydrolase [Chryseolinea sp.]|nr:alpha/beta fold hydrolase [Chryseolinea sp.]